MAGQATIHAGGYVTIATSGIQTGNVLNQVNNLVKNAGSNLYFSDPSITVTSIAATAPTAPGAVYGIQYGYNGTLTLPTGQPNGYAAVVLETGTNVTLSGGDPTTAIASAGKLAYTGNSTAVAAFGSNSVINDSGNLANIAVDGSNMAVTLSGVEQSLRIDGGSQGAYTETGRGANITLATLVAGTVAGGVAGSSGGATPSVGSANAAIPVQNAISNFQLTDTTALSLQDSFAASVVVLSGGANTISASAGANTVYATTGNDVYFEGNAQTFFVGATGKQVAVSTIFGGAGNDTVFAQAGVNYTEGSGNNLFSGGTQAALDAAASVSGATAFHSTVTATTGHDLLFGGTIGDQYNLGGGSEVFVGGGGADTLFGGSVAPTIFGGSNESLKLIGTNAGIVVASGDKDVIDASKANQGSTFFVSSVANVLNTTLVGSTATASLSGAHDSFVIGHAATTVTASGAAHTISIENFHTGDAFFLSGYTAADGAAFKAAVATPTPSGNVSFTLSDNTTVTFVGTHPTATFNGGTVAL